MKKAAYSIQTQVELRPTLKNISLKLTKCTQQSAQYSMCVTKKSLNVNEKECQKEFQEYLLCLKKS